MSAPTAGIIPSLGVPRTLSTLSAVFSQKRAVQSVVSHCFIKGCDFRCAEQSFGFAQPNSRKQDTDSGKRVAIDNGQNLAISYPKSLLEWQTEGPSIHSQIWTRDPRTFFGEPIRCIMNDQRGAIGCAGSGAGTKYRSESPSRSETINNRFSMGCQTG